MVLFLTGVITLFAITYWARITRDATLFYLEEKTIQAFFLARGGIEDAIYTLQQDGMTWTGAKLTHFSQPEPWKSYSGDGSGNTFYKDTKEGHLWAGSALLQSEFHLFFDAKLFVTLVGDPDTEVFTVMSRSEIPDTNGQDIYTMQLVARVLKSATDEYFIVSLKEE